MQKFGFSQIQKTLALKNTSEFGELSQFAKPILVLSDGENFTITMVNTILMGTFYLSFVPTAPLMYVYISKSLEHVSLHEEMKLV